MGELTLSRVISFVGIAVAAYLLFVTLAWIFQRKLIYLPMGRVPSVDTVLPGAVEVVLATQDGLRLGGWFVPSETEPPTGTVAVFNGNAGNRSFRAPLASALSRRGFSVLLFDYRGYGGNSGSPTEEGLIADAQAVRDYLESRQDVDADRIVYFGESLGASVAVAAAAERPPAALVLRSPFTSLTAMGRLHYPFLPVRRLLKDRFPSAERITLITCPLLVIAGDRDQIVPVSESRDLYEAARMGLKRLFIIRGADHNDYELLAGDRLLREVGGFLEETLGLRRGP